MNLTDRIKAIRRPEWLRRSMEQGASARVPWLVAVQELGA